MTAARKRIVLVCPGRGTYTKTELGFFSRPAPPAIAAEIGAMVRYADEVRAARGDATLTDLDGAGAFSARHVAGENAGALIYTATAADALRIDHERCEVVAVLGNSMGWYTALHVGGALGFDEGLRLVETMAGFQRGAKPGGDLGGPAQKGRSAGLLAGLGAGLQHEIQAEPPSQGGPEARRAAGPIGGQVIWPLVDDEWRVDLPLNAHVFLALNALWQAGLSAGWSISLGGFVVLWGEHAAIRELLARLPKRKLGEREYPFQLQGHAAFHSPLMKDVSAKAHEDLADLQLSAPSVPLVDGRGRVWNPLWSDPAQMLAYTLGHQVTEPFDFTNAVRVALRTFAPDHLVLLGPGDSLGSALAQVLIQEGWQGLDSKTAFLARQAGEDPYLIALARPGQSARVSSGV